MSLNRALRIIKNIKNYFLRPFLISLFFSTLFLFLFKIQVYFFRDYSIRLVCSLSGISLGFLLINSFRPESLLKKILTEFNSSFFLLTVLTILIASVILKNNASSYIDTLTIVAVISGVIHFLLKKNEISESIKIKELQIGARAQLQKYLTSKKTYTIISSLLLIGFFIRIYKLGDLSLWWDELLTGTYVARILKTGIPLSPSGFEYYWRGIPYHYLVSFFVILFGKSEFWLRFPSVLFGVGLIFISFFITNKINKTLAICVALTLCFSTYNIEYSRFARFYIMNAFLFFLNIEFFWKGFFENKKIYKFLSLFVFLIAMLTVQLGALFLAAILYWMCYKAYLVLIKKENLIDLIKKNIAYLAIFFIFIFANNPFDLIGIYKNPPYTMAALEQVNDTNIEYLFLGIPKVEFHNNLIPFFKENYAPLIFSIITCSYLAYLIISKIKQKKELGYLEYILTVFSLSFVIFEFANPYSKEPRLYFIFEPIYVITTLFGGWLILNFFSFKKQSLFLIFFTLLLLVIPTPNFIQRINTSYGDDVSADPFRSTWAQAYRSDSKGTVEFLKQHITDDDIWINTMEPAYYYFDSNPDYIINQNYKWKNMWRDETFTNEQNNFIDIRYDAILLHQASEIRDLVSNNPDKNIWLVVNGANLKTLYTKQLENDFVEFINNEQEKTVYISPDNLSRVLLFPKK